MGTFEWWISGLKISHSKVFSSVSVTSSDSSLLQRWLCMIYNGILKLIKYELDKRCPCFSFGKMLIFYSKVTCAFLSY